MQKNPNNNKVFIELKAELYSENNKALFGRKHYFCYLLLRMRSDIFRILASIIPFGGVGHSVIWLPILKYVFCMPTIHIMVVCKSVLFISP